MFLLTLNWLFLRIPIMDQNNNWKQNVKELLFDYVFIVMIRKITSRLMLIMTRNTIISTQSFCHLRTMYFCFLCNYLILADSWFGPMWTYCTARHGGCGPLRAYCTVRHNGFGPMWAYCAARYHGFGPLIWVITMFVVYSVFSQF